MSTQQQLLDRWRAFLTKVTARLRDVLAEAERGCADLVQSNPTDPITLTNVMSALQARKNGLDRKINDTFSQQVSQQIADGSSAFTHEDMRGSATQIHGKLLDVAENDMKNALAWMDETWERFRVRWSAQMVRAMWPHAQAAMQKPVACSRCGAPIQPTVRHQAESVTCKGCNSVNQVSPEQVVYMYFASAPHALAEEQTLGKRLAITKYRGEVEAWRRAENARTGNWPEEGIDSLRRWEAMERDYWTSYTQAKAQVSPMSPKDVQEFVESRMKPFMQYTLEQNDVWRRAHGMPTRT
jgi:hypothetical protein